MVDHSYVANISFIPNQRETNSAGSTQNEAQGKIQNEVFYIFTSLCKIIINFNSILLHVIRIVNIIL